MKRKNYRDLDTGEHVKVLVPGIEKESADFLKVFPRYFWESLQDSSLSRNPVRFFIWVFGRLGNDNTLTATLADYERETGYCHAVCAKHFQRARESGFLFQVGRAGNNKHYAVPTKFCFRSSAGNKKIVEHTNKQLAKQFEEPFNAIQQKGEVTK